MSRPNIPAAEPLRSKRISAGLLISIALTLILGGIPFGLGKHIEFNSPGPFDSGAFVYSAKRLVDGARIWVDEMPSARTGTLIANIIGVKLFGFNDIGPKVVQMLLQLGALGFMFYALRRVFGSAAAVVGTTVAAVYLSAPLIAKFGNVKEQFMIPFMIAAACCFLLYGYSRKQVWLILSGFFAIQPYYFKPTGLSIVIALGVCIIAGNVLSKKPKQLVLDLALFLAGYIVGLLVPGSLYFWQRVPQALMYTLPVVILKAGVVLGAIVFGVVAIVKTIRRVRLLKHLRQVSKWMWIAGLCLIFIAFTAAVLIIKKEPGSENSDIASYFYNIPLISLPRQLYLMADAQIGKLIAASGLRKGYVVNSWKMIGMSNLAPRVFRYYKALSVPILLALGSIVTALCLWLPGLIKKTKNTPDNIQSKLVGMLSLWWILDMAFVWGSPRSYEQYYLPLCASGAMLSGFIIWKWQKQLFLSKNKMPLLAGGLAVVVLLVCLSMPIFIGQRYSPDTGADYVKNYGHRRRGFGPAMKELPGRQKGAWISTGDYIRTHSSESDTIYIWGWVPGIYVQAQRMAPINRAFYGDMHVTSPQHLGSMVNGMVRQFEQTPPKFIVDTRKIHFPNDRPPLELWPHSYSKEKRFGIPIPNDPAVVAQYNLLYKKLLAEQFDPRQKEYASLPGMTSWLQYAPWTKAMLEEAERYEAMKPLREFVMANYRIVRQYGNHILFEHIEMSRQQIP